MTKFNSQYYADTVAYGLAQSNSPMRYAVIGAKGQLGRDLCPRLPGEVIPLGRPDVDLADPAGLEAILNDRRPDILINCAAYNFVDKAESEPDVAFAVNTWGVRQLARICQKLSLILTHLSSDFVFGFNQRRDTPYCEVDLPGPLSAYGLSKLCGEYAVQAECERHFIIRTCGLYGVWGSGGKGTNFVETMLRLAGQGKPLKVVADQVCTPSYTVDVAQAIVALIATDCFGLYHITNAGSTSWHDFAKAIFEQAGIHADLSPTTSHEYAAPAKRPGYSVLSNDKLKSIGIAQPRDWREALAAYMNERQVKARHVN